MSALDDARSGAEALSDPEELREVLRDLIAEHERLTAERKRWENYEQDHGREPESTAPPTDDEREALIALLAEMTWGSGRLAHGPSSRIADHLLANGFHLRGPITDAIVERVARRWSGWSRMSEGYWREYVPIVREILEEVFK